MKDLDYRSVKVAEIDNPAERRVIAALKASNIGVFEFEPETDTAFWDNRVRELWGIHGTDKITYDVVVSQVHPDDRAMHDESTAKALDPDGDGRMDMTYRLYPKDGHPMRWVRATAECFFQDGVAKRLVGTVSDVTEECSAIQHNKLLVNELQHRVKNTLATASAIVSLSRRGSTNIDSYFEAVDERLRNLSASHDVLRRSDWSPVQFSDLFAKAAMSFLGANWSDRQITLTADELEIPAQHVMTLSMAFHELLNNAAKYGGLLGQEGTISITVTQEPAGITMRWEESGGPDLDVVRPDRTGFGTILLEEILPGQLNGTAEISFERNGLRYSLRVPPLKSGS